MKTLSFLMLASVLAAGTAPALAQQPPPPNPNGTPNPAMRQRFDATRRQMESIRTQERSQMLGALSAQHRQLLGSIAAELATSSTPDYRAAAQRLDGALSSGEKQAILNAAQNARTQERAAFEQMRSQFNNGSPPGGPMMGNRPPGGPGMPGAHNPTAGEVLLRTALGGFGPMMR